MHTFFTKGTFFLLIVLLGIGVFVAYNSPNIVGYYTNPSSNYYANVLPSTDGCAQNIILGNGSTTQQRSQPCASLLPKSPEFRSRYYYNTLPYYEVGAENEWIN